MQLAQDILDAWDTASINLNPDNMTPKDFNDYYSSMVSIIANDGYVYQAISENQNSAVASLDDARVSFSGVSSNDELSNLIMFQNAYNANSRYINVVADMLDTLINKVGNW
jgi:flagellar hook-associated protein 1 FlgK